MQPTRRSILAAAFLGLTLATRPLFGALRPSTTPLPVPPGAVLDLFTEFVLSLDADELHILNPISETAQNRRYPHWARSTEGTNDSFKDQIYLT